MEYDKKIANGMKIKLILNIAGSNLKIIKTNKLYSTPPNLDKVICSLLEQTQICKINK